MIIKAVDQELLVGFGKKHSRHVEGESEVIATDEIATYIENAILNLADEVLNELKDANFPWN